MVVLSKTRSLSPALALFAACGLVASSASAIDIFWNNASGGAWNVGGNWLPNTVPSSAGDTAVIDLAGTYTVSVTAAQSTGPISILNPSAMVSVNSGVNLNLLGSQIINDGTLRINSTGGGSQTYLMLAGANAEISGAGSLVLNASSNPITAYLTTNVGQSLTNALGHTIRGTGQIYLTLINNGLVSADVASRRIELLSAAKTNNATMRALNGGILFVNTTVNQGAGGTLHADAGAVQYSGGTVNGGTLTAANAGEHRVVSASTFGAFTNNAPLLIDNGHVANFSGAAVTNNGSITINPQAGGSQAYLQLTGPSPAVFGGSGQIVLNASSSLDTAYLTSNVGQTMVNDANHTIRGTGRIYVSLTNNGQVNADTNGKVLELLSQAKTNNSVMRAIGGGILQIAGATLTQSTSGELIADGSEVRLSGATVSGGTLLAQNGGAIRVISPSTLGSLTNNAPLLVNNGANMNVSGETIINNGSITVNPQAGGSASYIQLTGAGPTTFTGNGQIALNASTSLDTAYLTSNVGQTLINDANHTIRGTGRIYVPLTNNSVVSADVSGKAIELLSSAKTNNSSMRATGGGVLQISNVAVNQSPTGEIVAENASLVSLQGATINGGELNAMGSGDFFVAATSTFGTLTNNAPVRISSGGTSLNISQASLINNGTITVNNGVSGSTSSFQLVGPSVTTLSGTGTLRLRASGTITTATVATNVGQLLVQSSGHTISGSGSVIAPLENNGLVSADIDGRALQLISGAKTNNATMRAIDGGTLRIASVTLTQSAPGQVLAANNGTVAIASATVSGGSLNASGNGQFTIESTSSFGPLTNNAPIQVLTGGTSLNVLNNGFVNNGTITLNNGVSGTASNFQLVGSDATISGTGALVLNASSSTATAVITTNVGQLLTNAGDHIIAGRGRSNARILNRGIIAPGPLAGGAGLIEMFNTLTLAEESRIHIEIGGDTAALYDRITSNSALNIDGALVVTYRPSFTPTRDQSYTIMQGSVRNGEFFDVVMPPISGGVGLRLRYTANAVILDAVCYADVNEDGGIDGADVEAFFDLWEAGDPVADLNNDGGIDGLDVEFFFDVWENGGC
ncbi:MAG: hypothetical protein KF859_07205 [Phycisphaeraceae bacterium]|nr:hypothetical protein [Phycisphaeraceae bacterium]